MAHGWLIVRDELEGQTVNIAGPRDIPPALLARLEAGDGLAFRLLDDDGEVYYLGRFLELDADGQAAAGLGDWAFSPLDDFGGPDSGCTAVEYQSAAGAWVAL